MGTQQFTRKELATSENGSNNKTSFCFPCKVGPINTFQFHNKRLNCLGHLIKEEVIHLELSCHL
jgi:hypothetical protein